MGKTIADSLIEKGEKKGLKKGREQEAVASRQKMLLVQMQERFGPLPAEVKQELKATKDISTLEGWIRRFAHADSLDDMGIANT